jgi:hypothetical protein
MLLNKDDIGNDIYKNQNALIKEHFNIICFNSLNFTKIIDVRHMDNELNNDSRHNETHQNDF